MGGGGDKKDFVKNNIKKMSTLVTVVSKAKKNSDITKLIKLQLIALDSAAEGR